MKLIKQKPKNNNMKRIKENPISSVLGAFFIIVAFVLLFVKTNYDLPLWALGLVALVGLLLLFAKDKLIDILTLGLSRLLKDVTKK